MTQRDKNIIELFQYTDKTVEEIAMLNGCKKGTVYRILKINNIPTRRRKIIFTQTDVDNIIKKYLSHIPILQIQKEYHCSYDKIQAVLKANDIKQYNSYSSLKNPNIIENYFEQIDNKNKAYWLGWLISDGSIINQPEKGKYRIELTLQEQDEIILHLLEKDLGVINKVSIFQDKYRRFGLGNKKLVQDLAILSIDQNKTFSVQIPNISKELMPHLIRGLYEGDGWITLSNSEGYWKGEFGITGNLQVITAVKNYIESLDKTITKKKIEKNKNIYKIRWSKIDDIIKIRNIIYKDCENHYLPRKKDKIFQL